MTHEQFIEETYRLAREAVRRGDHPFGALLVRDGEIVLRAHNSVHSSHDITGHAELNLVRLATGRFSARELEHCTLYTSTEPCLMCCGGIYWANIRQVVFGVSSAALAALSGGNFVIPSPSLFARLEPVVQVTGPILESEGLAIHAPYWASYVPPDWMNRQPSDP